MTNPQHTGEAAVLQTMVLLSTLATAAEVRHAALERRAGRDPSTQAALGVVRPALYRAGAELQEMLLRLQAGLVHARSRPEDGTAALVRRYDALMLLHRTSGLLETVHQRLLSLYPAVDEALVEEARRLQGGSRALLEADDDRFLDALAPLLERTLAFTQNLRHALARTS